MAATSEDRLAAINRWWNAICGGFSYPLSLREAFVDVLGRLSDEAFARFMDYFPIVRSLNGRLGYAFRPIRLPDWTPHRGRPTILAFAPKCIEQTPRGLLSLVAHEVGHVVLGHLSDLHKPHAQCEAEVAEFLTRLGLQEPDVFEEQDNYRRLLSVERDLRIALADLSRDQRPEIDDWVRAVRVRLGKAIAELHMTLSHYPVPACTRSPDGIVRTAVRE